MAYINYIILDAARMKAGTAKAKSFGENYISLFSGKTEEDTADMAPYIFAYNPRSEFADWFMEEGWGRGWGIMVRSGVTLEELLNHCRKFLVKENDSGQEIYFRYFDPRVLSIFLPTCTSEQLKEFFGPIDYIMIEDIDPNFAQLIWLENYKLYMKAIGKEELLKRFRAGDYYSGEQFEDTTVDQSQTKRPEKEKKNHSSASNTNEKQHQHVVSSENKSNEAGQPVDESSDIDNNEKWLKFFFDGK